MEFVGGGGGGRGGGAFFDVSPLICTLSGESYSFSLIIMLYYFILGLGGRGGVAVFVVFPSCILLGLLVPVGFGGTASNLSFRIISLLLDVYKRQGLGNIYHVGQYNGETTLLYGFWI